MSQFIVNIDGTVKQDKVFLCDRLLNKQGVLYPIQDLKTIMRLNQNDEVSFTIYKNNNGSINPYWDKLDDIAIILVEGKGYFEISVPKTEDNCVFKEITGISLGEAETYQRRVTLEINTADDISRDDYVKTILYDASNPEGSLLHRIFKYMPHYTIGHVDASVASIQRTFSCADTPIYDFLQTIAQELECIFIFDNFKREVNCYDLKDYCNKPSCISAGNYRNVKDGVCQCCGTSTYITYGYGKDTNVCISSENLSESITLTGDKDSVKNYFKIEGGDDTITNMIGSRLMEGNHIMKFSPHQLKQMSTTLQQALVDQAELVASYQDEYNRLNDERNKKIDEELYYQSGMMPGMEKSKTTPQSLFQEIFGSNGKITYACSTTKNQNAKSVLSSVERFAKIFLPKEYDIETTLISSNSSADKGVTSITFSVVIMIKEAYREDNMAESAYKYTSNVTLSVKCGSDEIMIADTEIDPDTKQPLPVFSNDYYMYVKQNLEMALAESDVSDSVVCFDPPIADGSLKYYDSDYMRYADYDEKTDIENLPDIHYTKYSIERLKSFHDAYEACSQIVAEMNSDIAADTNSILHYINDNGSKSCIYDDLLKKYYNYIACIDARMSYLNNLVESIVSEKNALNDRIKEIQAICNMENFLKEYENGIHGDELWNELCSFIREDVYKNENYIGDGFDDATIMKNVEGLIERAKEELERACEISYSITTTIGNLLTMWEFQPLWDDFTLGNWIHVKIDGEVLRLRLISVMFDYSDLSHIEVEFSDVTKTKSPVMDIKSILHQASSMASNFNAVTRQAEQGSMVNKEFLNMKEYGLDVANTMIVSANKEIPTIDNNGITCRTWNDDKNNYDEEQVRLIHNLLCFTSDAWKHTRLALGKILYYNTDKSAYEFAYGLNAEVLISNIIMSEALKIYNASGTYEITDKGFFITNGNKTIEIDASEPSMTISVGNKEYFHFSVENGLVIDGTGEFSGHVIVGNKYDGKGYIELNPDKPSMIINNGEKDLFTFNINNDGLLILDVGLESPEIIGGVIKSKNYDENIPQGMIINLGKEPSDEPSMYMHSDGDTFFSLDSDNGMQAFKGKIGGWTIDEDSIYAEDEVKIDGNTAESKLSMYSTGQITSRIKVKDTDSLEQNACATLSNGKWCFGLYNPNGVDTKFYTDRGYTDISQAGIYAYRKTDDSEVDEPESLNSTYLLKVDTLHDMITIANHSKYPALRIKNFGEGDTLYCENTHTGSDNKAFHCKVYSGEGSDYYLSVFGEYGSTSSNGVPNQRLVFRSDSHNEEGIEEKCDKSALGTVTFPWNEVHATNVNSTSDLKEKDVIGVMDKQKSLEFINALEPIEYTFKNSTSKRIHMGFGAQTVAKTAKNLNMGDLAVYSAAVIGDEKNGEGYYQEGIDDSKLSWGLKYNEFEAPMVGAIQALYEKIEEQNTVILGLMKQIEELKER